jgi:hypothetical protein
MRASDRDGSDRGRRCHLRFIMNGREQDFAWTKIAGQTVDRSVRVVVVRSAFSDEGFERQEPTIVPWPTRDFEVSETRYRTAPRSRLPADFVPTPAQNQTASTTAIPRPHPAPARDGLAPH